MFAWNKKWLLVLVVAVTAFSSLGFWQLSRAQQKERMLRAAHSLEKRQHYDGSSERPKQYQKLSISGAVDNRHIFLLDNQFYRHQLGFNVLTAVVIAPGSAVLVDRGWIKAGKKRRLLPQPLPMVIEGKIQGYAYYPSLKQWVLSDIEEKIRLANVLIIEKINIHKLEKKLGLRLSPFVLRQTSASSDGLVREWKIVNMKPDRHRAYAFQWFSFAVVAMVIYFAMNRRRDRNGGG